MGWFAQIRLIERVEVVPWKNKGPKENENQKQPNKQTNKHYNYNKDNNKTRKW